MIGIPVHVARGNQLEKPIGYIKSKLVELAIKQNRVTHAFKCGEHTLHLNVQQLQKQTGEKVTQVLAFVIEPIAINMLVDCHSFHSIENLI